MKDVLSRKTEVAGGYVLSKDEAHRCQSPEARKFDIGDIFICRDCGQRHILVDAERYQGGPFWQEYRES